MQVELYVVNERKLGGAEQRDCCVSWSYSISIFLLTGGYCKQSIALLLVILGCRGGEALISVEWLLIVTDLMHIEVCAILGN